MSELTQVFSADEARQFYARGDAAHDFDHVLRVAQMGEFLARAEGADPHIVRIAAYLHDVPVESLVEPTARQGMARSAHHLAAADFARRVLTNRGVRNQIVEAVVHSIEAHRFRDQSIVPQTLEARCLYDADKLDSMGAIGVGRCFAFAGSNDSRLWTEPWTDVPSDAAQPEGEDYTPVHEYVYKLRRLIDTLHTPSARRIGVARHAFMQAFFDQLDVEMSGQA